MNPDADGEHQATKIDALVQLLLTEGVTPAHLDDAVRDAAAERASELLSKGLEAQVRFLLQGSDHSWKPEDVLFAAERAKRTVKVAAPQENPPLPCVMRLSLEQAFLALRECHAIMLEDGQMIRATLAELQGSPENEFAYFEWSYAEGPSFCAKFAEGENQTVAVSGSLMTLVNTEGEELGVYLLAPMDVGGFLRSLARPDLPVSLDVRAKTFEEWKERFRSDCFGSTYEEGLRRAGEPCWIIPSDEIGEDGWAVALGDGFWMDVFEDVEAAEAFVRDIGWPLEGVVRKKTD